jgi:hypothetical protein
MREFGRLRGSCIVKNSPFREVWQITLRLDIFGRPKGLYKKQVRGAVMEEICY